MQLPNQWFHTCFPQIGQDVRIQLLDVKHMLAQSRDTLETHTVSSELRGHVEDCEKLRRTHLAAIAGNAGAAESKQEYAQQLDVRLAAVSRLWKLTSCERRAASHCPAERTSEDRLFVRWLLACFDSYRHQRAEQLNRLE